MSYEIDRHRGKRRLQCLSAYMVLASPKFKYGITINGRLSSEKERRFQPLFSHGFHDSLMSGLKDRDNAQRRRVDDNDVAADHDELVSTPGRIDLKHGHR